MVSLEGKLTYIEKIKGNLKLNAFNSFLSGSNISCIPNDEMSEANNLFCQLASSIQTNNKETFEILYNQKSRSNPNKESPSPFVNDDYLIFCFLVGVIKFKIDKAWIKRIIDIRSPNQITTTFDNILIENFYSKNNLPEIVLMFFKLNDQSLITNNFLNDSFQQLSKNTILFESRSDFQILCAIKAYELVILFKEVPDGSEIHLLKAFNRKFITRMKVFSWLIETCLFLIFLLCLIKLPVYSPKTVEIINKYGYLFSILGALGITLISNQIAFIKKQSLELTMKVFGYPKGLIERLN